MRSISEVESLKSGDLKAKLRVRVRVKGGCEAVRGRRMCHKGHT